MYQLLIVDDETSVVDSLAFTIPWEDYGITEVHRAYSAAEAMEAAAKHPIDMIITDIQMPEMNGLELIEQIRLTARKIRCIILSGHDDFEYAQKAIQFQTMNYLLKPVNMDALIQSVVDAIADIEREWAEISSYQQIKHALHANKPLLRNQLLNELLQNKSIEAEILSERLKMLDLPFRSSDPCLMMVVRLEEDFSGYGLQSLSLLEYAVSNIAEEVFQDLYGLWHCLSEQGYLVFLVRSKNKQDLNIVDSYAIKLQNHVQKFLKGSLSICLSRVHEFPDELADMYVSCVSTINRNIGRNKSYFTTADEATGAPQERLMNMNEPPLLTSLLEANNWDEALAKIRRLLAIDDASVELTSNQLFTYLLFFSSAFTMYMPAEMTAEEQLGDEFELFLRKKSLLSSTRLYNWADKIITTLRTKASDHIEDAHERIATKVRTFIQSHLAEGISLQTVADHVDLHPVYLSKVYKTVTGETIGDYLFRIRMERAAHLLRQTEMKITEVSSNLGFLAPPHFIKIFKKHYGCTPQEYRTR